MSHRRVALIDAPARRQPLAADWRDRSHWNGGRRRPCRICGHLSFLLDHTGLPAHKVCVDNLI